ncbi:MAG: NADH-quinone oxidoreductase subunit M [Actinobacteria bacterium]|nr:NADH-quinone oxidoreductase subunit M [Actinomycetota bacterium]NBY16035.1 NADH-quinone oxidoreductase subunit M [Actinomycetota bacterium]
MLTALMLTPLVGAVAVLALPATRALLAKQIALAVSLITTFGAVYFGVSMDPSATGLQFKESHEWIPTFSINWALGIDGVAAVLIVMATILVPLVIIASWNDVERIGRGSVKGYFGLILILETFMIGVFAATDLFLFYVFFEAMLIPVYFLIGRFGGPQRAYAAMKFLLYSLVGGLFMLASLIGLYIVSARTSPFGPSFDFETLASLQIDPATQKMLFLGFFFAFAVKAPMVPFHTWLPDAAAESTPGTATLLVGVLDKVGTFGMLHFLLPIFPDASRFYAPVIITLAVISIFYGALLAIGQNDMMRLVAFSSISHFGFIVLGIFVFTAQGLSGSTFYMVNHGFSTGALFLVVGFLASRRGSSLISDFGGVTKTAPVLAGVFLLAGLSSLALPGMSSFVSEFLVLLGTFSAYQWVAVIATTGIVLAAFYILWMYQRVITGEPSQEVTETVTEISKRELLAIVPIIAIIIGLGVYPQAALRIINPAINQVQQVMKIQADTSSLGGEG